MSTACAPSAARSAKRSRLTVDANQSYSVEDAIEALNRMAEFGIDIAEQPVAAADHEGLKRVTDSVPVTVEADESASSVARVFELVRERAVDAVSLKIPKLGGLINTLAAARICEAGGVEYRMGAAVGSRLLSAQAMHLAAALPGIAYACELGEFARLMDDPFEGIEIENGRLKLPEGPGSGVSLRNDEQSGGDAAGPEGHADRVVRSAGMGQIARIIAPASRGGARARHRGSRTAAPALNIATYKGADREKLILDGAKREGKVSIYSGMIENQALRPLVEAFEKKYPFVDVEYWRGDSASDGAEAAVGAARAAHRRRHLRIHRRRGGGDPGGRIAADLVAIGGELSAEPDRSRRDVDRIAAELFRRRLQHAPGAGGRSAEDL